MILDELSARAEISAMDVSGCAIGRFALLAEMLREANMAQNLVSAASLEAVWQRHFIDSTQLLDHVPRETRTWLDLGTGAGFPGLAVAIVRPEMDVHLVESRPLRSRWLNEAVMALELRHVSIAPTPLEKVPTAEYSVISARAFAPLPRLLRLAARFSTSDTTWVLPKGRSAAQELESLSGWDHTFHVEQSRTDPQSGIIVGRVSGKKGR